jgi:hypothetical protein
MIVAKYGNYVRKFMWQLCEWGRVDICMTFHKRAFDFFNSITHWFDNLQNCATMNCQGNVNSTLSTHLPRKFSYIVVIIRHNHFESPNMLLNFDSAWMTWWVLGIVFELFEYLNRWDYVKFECVNSNIRIK